MWVRKICEKFGISQSNGVTDTRQIATPEKASFPSWAFKSATIDFLLAENR